MVASVIDDSMQPARPESTADCLYYFIFLVSDLKLFVINLDTLYYLLFCDY